MPTISLPERSTCAFATAPSADASPDLRERLLPARLLDSSVRLRLRRELCEDEEGARERWEQVEKGRVNATRLHTVVRSWLVCGRAHARVVAERAPEASVDEQAEEHEKEEKLSTDSSLKCRRAHCRCIHAEQPSHTIHRQPSERPVGIEKQRVQKVPLANLMPHALHSVAFPPAPSAHPWRQSGVPVAAHAALAQRLLALFHFPSPLLPSCSALIVEIAAFKAV